MPALQPRGRVPQGYARVLLYNQDSVLVNTYTEQLSEAALNHYEPLRIRVVVPQHGYAVAYAGNESDVDVLFDDVEVEHRQGLQVQETHYDPWGLELAGLNYRSPGLRALSRYRYNGKEAQPELGLGWADYGARMYDAQVPRFTTPDPLAAKHAALTPYNYVANNPVNGTDPDGKDFVLTVTRNIKGDITGVNISALVYINGSGASDRRAKQLNAESTSWLKPRDIDGVKVSIGLTYVYDSKKKNRRLEAG